MKQRRGPILVVGLVLSIAFVALSLRHVDLHGLGDALGHSHWWPWYVLAPTIYLAGHVVRGVRCRTILRPHCDLNLITATNCTVIGYGANNLLPARMGEFVRAYVLGRQAGVPVSLALAITFLERILDGLTITGILLVAGLFAPLPDWGRELRWAAGLVFASATIAVALITAARPFVLRVAQLVTARLPLALDRRITAILNRAFGATDCLRDPILTIKIVALSLTVWIVEGGMFLVVLPAFDLPMNPLWAAMALSVTNLGILIPSSPGYIGPFHYFCMQALQIFGVPADTALGYAIMVHLLYYVPITIWGVGALTAYGVSLGTAAQTVPAPALAVATENEVLR
ncbi:MAG: flippase-like domain-containing protein [Deltaproteobacteria bacterium]|nr:flippase-like domain-containing protein [Deltaproteobacteria bacterium]MBI3391487.1 flippase-like domain-containing protein [Deltaproteobacteria bacterium]